jgi:hypothetical protein
MQALVAIIVGFALSLYMVFRWKGMDRPVPGLDGASREERAAARRLGYAPVPGTDPVAAIEDPRLAAMAIVLMMGALDGPLNRDEVEQIVIEAQVTFRTDRPTAESLAVMAAWILRRSRARRDLLGRLAATVAARAGREAAPDLMRMASAAAAHARPIGREEQAALDLIARAFQVNV